MSFRDRVSTGAENYSTFVTRILEESGTESSVGESDNDISNDLSDDSSNVSNDEQPECRPNLENWNWTFSDNTVRQINYTSNSGINPVVNRHLTTNGCTELDVLNQFLGNTFWEQIVTETNAYATKCIMAGGDNRNRAENWTNVGVDELKAYFALIILMAQNPKSKITDYWSTRKIIYCPIFGETMVRDRFWAISKYLHFSSSVVQSDKLKKIRPMVDMFQLSFKKLFTPGKFISIDESLMAFRGRLSFIQFNPSKRARFGIKIYKVCDSETGYCYNFKIYTGKEMTDHPHSGQGLLVSEQVVLNVCQDLFEEGRVLVMDNWYSSPYLFSQLLNRNTYAIGTLRTNRKNVPQEIKTTKLQKGELVYQSSNNVLCFKWKDRKDVAMLSTCHDRPNFEEIVSQKERGKPNPKKQLKPNVVVEYNKHMGGVDKQDQKLSCFPVMRRCVKGYKKLFFYLFDIVLFNASVVHQLVTKKKLHLSEFRLNIAEQILQSVQLPERTPRGRPSTENPLRLQGKFWGHFIEKIPPTTKARPSKRCKVCFKHGIRSEIVYQCKKCLIPLHMDNCFEIYHSQINY